MDDLFHLFRNKKSGSVGGLNWTYGNYPVGAAGEIYEEGSDYFVVLDEDGNCMTTATHRLRTSSAMAMTDGGNHDETTSYVILL